MSATNAADPVGRTNKFIHGNPLQTINGYAVLLVECNGEKLALTGTAADGLLPGWEALFLYSGFAPIFVLQLRHPTFGDAVWYISSAGDRLDDHIASLSERHRSQLRVQATPVLRRLLYSLTTQPEPCFDDAVRGFLKLDDSCRMELLDLCRDATEQAGQFIPIRELPATLIVNPGDGGATLALSKTLLQSTLELDLQDCVPEMISRRGFFVPCPITGADVACQGSICFDDFHFAYRFIDSSRRMVFYVIAGHELSHVYALYIPCISTSFALLFREGVGDEARQIFQALIPAHAVRYGMLLETYLTAPLAGISSPLRAPPWTHIGHQLWNELTGIDRHLENITAPAAIAEFIVPDGDRAIEFYGPIETLFPQLDGRVVRGLRGVDEVIRHAYRNRRLIVRITRRHVSSSLRQRVLDCARAAAPEPGGLAAIDAPSGGLTILLGLRLENRTLVDLGGFYDTLILSIRAAHTTARFVIDGHNVAAADGLKYCSYGETSELGARVRMAEHAIAARLQAHHGADVVISAIGLPVQENLVLIDRCDGFVAPWGAGLAKYRWVCNLPGYVLCSHWNLENRGDLRIYDSDETMQDAAPMRWIDREHVIDAPNSERLIDHLDHPQWMNFQIDEQIATAEILDWLSSLPSQPPGASGGAGGVAGGNIGGLVGG